MVCLIELLMSLWTAMEIPHQVNHMLQAENRSKREVGALGAVKTVPM